MNKVSVIIISLLLACLSATSIIGQTAVIPTPVDISTEKININGDLFFAHKVLAGQTLYSISRAYQVPIESIIKQNPSTKDGLKAWSTIFVPIADSLKNVKQKPVSPPVDRRPTTTPVAIPVTPPVTQEYARQEDLPSKKYRKHTVKWYETLGDIADFYNVSVEAIVHLNNLKADTVFKKRQKILIPDGEYQIPPGDMEEEEFTPVVPVVPVPQDQTQELTSFSYSYIDERGYKVYSDNLTIDENLYRHDYRTHKISLILPFNASQDTDKASTNQMDFYSGVLMAIKDLQSTVQPFEYYLNVIDLSNYPSATEMLSSGIIDDSELIIGPIIQKDLEAVAQYAKNNRVPLISPMDVRTEGILQNNPYLFLFPSLPNLSQDNLISEFRKSNPQDSTKSIIIYEKGTEGSNLVRSAFDSFNKNYIEYTPFSYGILEGRGIDTLMHVALDSVHHNKVYVASDSEAFVSDVLRNLYLLQSVDTVSINVYGSGRWINFETLEAEYLHSLNTHFSLQYYVDYSDSTTASFVERYWEVFNAEPTPYSFQGYDITKYFLSSLIEFGRVFPAYIPNKRQKLLQSDVLFRPISYGSGFKNESTRDIVYLENWEVSNWK